VELAIARSQLSGNAQENRPLAAVDSPPHAAPVLLLINLFVSPRTVTIELARLLIDGW
jgi:hypothetical protein